MRWTCSLIALAALAVAADARAQVTYRVVADDRTTLPDGAAIRDLRDASLAPDGSVTFCAALVAGGATTCVRERGGALTERFRVGGTTPAGAAITAGRVLATENDVDLVQLTAGRTGLWRAGAAGLARVVEEGDALPGGRTLGAIRDAVMNGALTVVVRADDGVWSFPAAGAPRALLEVGAAQPGGWVVTAVTAVELSEDGVVGVTLVVRSGVTEEPRVLVGPPGALVAPWILEHGLPDHERWRAEGLRLARRGAAAALAVHETLVPAVGWLGDWRSLWLGGTTMLHDQQPLVERTAAGLPVIATTSTWALPIDLGDGTEAVMARASSLFDIAPGQPAPGVEGATIASIRPVAAGAGERLLFDARLRGAAARGLFLHRLLAATLAWPIAVEGGTIDVGGQARVVHDVAVVADVTGGPRPLDETGRVVFTAAVEEAGVDHRAVVVAEVPERVDLAIGAVRSIGQEDGTWGRLEIEVDNHGIGPPIEGAVVSLELDPPRDLRIVGSLVIPWLPEGAHGGASVTFFVDEILAPGEQRVRITVTPPVADEDPSDNVVVVDLTTCVEHRPCALDDEGGLGCVCGVGTTPRASWPLALVLAALLSRRRARRPPRQ